MPSEADPGGESNSGDISTELFIDEDDDLIAAAFCSSWAANAAGTGNGYVADGAASAGSNTLKVKTGTGTILFGNKVTIGSHTYVCAEDLSAAGTLKLTSALTAAVADGDEITIAANSGMKQLALGNTRRTFSEIRKYYQEPVAYRWYKGLMVDQLKFDFQLKSKVKLTFSMKGSNNPAETKTLPVTGATFAAAGTTKSFTTMSGFVKLGGTIDALAENKQSSGCDLTINNSGETTDGLFQTEAIDSSLGDLIVSGNIGVWNSDITTLQNEAKEWSEKVIQIECHRTVGGVTTTYMIQMTARLKTPTDSKDGNKLKLSIPYQVYGKDNIKVVKTQVTA